ncbi:MAG: hypothetical protein JW862_06800 [Anaerolineales bacterium]|nr:hypothetical protein [Anaerolineales bacterium]
MLKRFLHQRIEIILASLMLLVSIYVVFMPAGTLMRWFTTDDAFYYFKTARNFAQGHGFSFDQIGRTGGFHPLWMLICIPIFSLARYDLILPLRIVIFVSLGLHAASIVLLYRLVKQVLPHSVALLTALLWSFKPYMFSIVVLGGMETTVSTLFILLLMYLTIQYRLADRSENTARPSLGLIGVVALLAIFARLDNIFLVAFVGLWLLFDAVKMRYLVIVDLVLGFGLVFASYLLRLEYRELYSLNLTLIKVTAVSAPFLRVGLLYLAGLYASSRKFNYIQQLQRILISVSLGTGLLYLIQEMMRLTGIVNKIPRSVLLIEWLLAFIGIATVHLAYSWLFHRSIPQSPVDDSGVSFQQWMTWLQTGTKYATPIGLGLASYLLFNRLYFGVFMPVSGQVKHFWGSLYTVYGNPVDSLSSLWGYARAASFGPWDLALNTPRKIAIHLYNFSWLTDRLTLHSLTVVLLLACAMLCLILIIRQWHTFKSYFDRLALLPLLAGGLVQVFQYNGMQYIHTRSWYWASQMIFITLVAAVLFTCLLRLFLKGERLQYFTFAITLVASIWVVFHFNTYLRSVVPFVPGSQNSDWYLEEVRFLEESTEPGSRIGMTGGGMVSYFINDRTIVNLDGLMNTDEYFFLLKENRTREYLDQIGLQYVYGNSYMLLETEPYDAIFQGHLVEMNRIYSIVLYRYQGANVQE